MPYLGVFFDWNLKTILSYMKSAPSNLSNCKISRKKQNCLNLGPKMFYLGIFGLKFQKTSVIFEISTLEFVKLRNLVKKWKFLIWNEKCFIWIFLAWNLKTILSYLKSTLSNLYNCKILWENENA